MDITISNTAQSKINHFITFIWGQYRHLQFVTIIVHKPSTAYHLQ